MKFLGWLYTQKNRDDKVGDLAKDCFWDEHSRKPRFNSNRKDWKDHLQSLGACDAALEAVDVAWDEYERFCTQSEEAWTDKPLPHPMQVNRAIRESQKYLFQLQKSGLDVPMEELKYRLALGEHIKWLGKVAEEAARREREGYLPFGRYACLNEFPLLMDYYSVEDGMEKMDLGLQDDPFSFLSKVKKMNAHNRLQKGYENYLNKSVPIKKPEHPERKPDEIFIGNFNEDGFKRVGWKTKRKGETPYDVYLNRLGSEGFDLIGLNGERVADSKPVFVKRSEIEAAGLGDRLDENGNFKSSA